MKDGEEPELLAPNEVRLHEGVYFGGENLSYEVVNRSVLKTDFH